VLSARTSCLHQTCCSLHTQPHRAPRVGGSPFFRGLAYEKVAGHHTGSKRKAAPLRHVSLPGDSPSREKTPPCSAPKRTHPRTPPRRQPLPNGGLAPQPLAGRTSSGNPLARPSLEAEPRRLRVTTLVRVGGVGVKCTCAGRQALG
jgi:hypothetical protein